MCSGTRCWEAVSDAHMATGPTFFVGECPLFRRGVCFIRMDAAMVERMALLYRASGADRQRCGLVRGHGAFHETARHTVSHGIDPATTGKINSRLAAIAGRKIAAA